jgi:hypothetical protein
MLEVSAAVSLTAVVLAALFAGRWVALGLAVLTWLGLNYWFTAPKHTLRVAHLQDIAVLAVFAVMAVVVSAVFDHAVRREVARRGQQPDVLDLGDLVIDFERREVVRDGVAVQLTPTEWAFLALLARNVGRLVSQTEILQEVWGPAYEKETHYLRVYASQLRRKIEADPAHPRHLITRSGQGYTLER